MKQIFANLARGMLAQSVNTTDTQFSVKNAIDVPSLSAGEFFIATVFTVGSGYGTNIEIVKVVQVDGNLWTVERGQEDTTAKEHPQDSHIELRLTAGALSDIHDELAKPKEWSAETVTKAEAEAISGDTRKAWTVTRVNEASQAWWERSTMMDKLDSIETDAKDDQLANEVPVVSTGNLKSTNVQSALEELQLDVDTINDDLETKVDKVVGQGLSDSNYTQAEKDKLAGLESSHFKGQFVSLEALQEAFSTATAGDYANVDEGVGFDVIRYVWDTSDSVWLAQLGISTQLTAAQIREEYESNPDTNVFSDFEKTKLEGIATEATKNRDDSENADKLHTHEFSEVAGLDIALADKASKTELITELALKADKVEGKVFSDTNFTQAEKDKLASLENYSDTNPFTDVQKTKLAGIVAGATKNRADSANADKVHTHTWSQVTGQPVTATRWPSWTEVTGKPVQFTPSTHTHTWSQVTGLDTTLGTKADKTTQVIAGTGLSGGGNLSANRTLSVNYGTTAGTATQGNDSRITGAFQKSQVVQSTGTSTTNVMSQEATTKAIANIPSVSKSSAYTVVAADTGKSIDTTSNVTIRASVFTVGDVIVVTNTSATNSSILAASGVTIRLAGSKKTGTLGLAGYGVATLRMVTSNVWFATGAGLI